jgi:hypothetical protein
MTDPIETIEPAPPQQQQHEEVKVQESEGDEDHVIVVSPTREPTTCDTCAWPHNKQTRARIVCPYCAYVTCVTCVKTDLLGSISDPRCMGCRRGWSIDFLNTHMTKAFMRGEYRAQRERVLFDRQQSLLPESQVAAVVLKNISDTATAIYRLAAEKHRLQAELDQIKVTHRRLTQRRQTGSQMFHRLSTNATAYTSEDVERVLVQDEALPHQVLGDAGNAAGAAAAATTPFVRRCPAEECRGFLSSKWTCNLCKTHVCKKCHDVLPEEKEEEKEEEKKDDAGGDESTAADNPNKHVCTEANLATVALLARDTKPCPACGSLITRISGCAHFFCTVPTCLTGFNWDTGAIIHGEVANPHYYEYMATRNNQGGGGGGVARALAPCRENVLPVFGELILLFPEYLVDPELMNRLGRVFHCARHFQRIVLNQLQRNIPSPVHFLSLRSRFLLRIISEATFKTDLQKAERLTQRYRAEVQVGGTCAARSQALTHFPLPPRKICCSAARAARIP